MKKLLALLILSILIFVGCNSSNTQVDNNSTIDNKYAENLNNYFKALKGIKKFNGGVLVQKDGKQILYKVYNMEEDQENSLHVDLDSQFDIHSISKLMAQAVVVNLEQNNLINRKDKINKYIPDFPKGDIISIQHLIKNQSGLPRSFSKDYPNLIEVNPETLIDYIKLESLLFEPGTESLYSTLGYQLLYFMISKITNKPFVQFLEETLFLPLQMHSTGAHFHLPKNNKNKLVKNHELDDGALVVVPNIQQSGKNQAKIYSSMKDLLTFINYVKEEPYRSLMQSKTKEIGWSGGGDGILSHSKTSLKSGYELVLFSNYDEIPFGQILEMVEKIMTDQSFDLPQAINRKAVPIAATLLKKYVGKYRVKEFNNNVFEFRLEDGQLVFYQDGERNTNLLAESDHTFFDQADSENYFEFRKVNEKKYQLVFHYKSMEIKGNKL